VATKVEQLVEKLRSNGIKVPKDYEFKRLRPGWNCRTAGAWSWTIVAEHFDIGSPTNVTDLLREKSLSIGRFGNIET